MPFGMADLAGTRGELRLRHSPLKPLLAEECIRDHYPDCSCINLGVTGWLQQAAPALESRMVDAAGVHTGANRTDRPVRCAGWGLRNRPLVNPSNLGSDHQRILVMAEREREARRTGTAGWCAQGGYVGSISKAVRPSV